MGLTQEQINELLEAKASLDKINARARYYSKRREAKRSILVAKAVKAGITVTEDEIEAEMNRK